MKLNKENSKNYLKTIKFGMPKSKNIATCLKAFFVGGVICCIGEGIGDVLGLIDYLSTDDISQYTTIIMITITGFLTGLGIYDKVGNFGGAGSIIPITGFANSVVSPAIEHMREGLVLGLCCNMFKIAGPVIVIGITSATFVGIIFLFI